MSKKWASLMTHFHAQGDAFKSAEEKERKGEAFCLGVCDWGRVKCGGGGQNITLQNSGRKREKSMGINGTRGARVKPSLLHAVTDSSDLIRTPAINKSGISRSSLGEVRHTTEHYTVVTINNASLS